MKIYHSSLLTCLFGAFLVFVTGCGSKVIYDRYLLTDNISSQVYTLPYNLNVKLHDSLTEGGVVVKTSDVTLRSANNHRWANDLSSQITSVFKDALYRHKVNKSYTFNVYVSKFYGSLNGQVDLDLMVEASLKHKKILKKAYTRTLQQSDKGYDALVATLKSGLISIADECAQDMLSSKR